MHLSSKNHFITMTRSIDGNYSYGFSDNCLFRYSYKLGHRLINGSYIWSKSYSFKSSPYPGQESLQRVVIFGDMGKVLWSSIVHGNNSLLVKSFSLLDIYIYIYIHYFPRHQLYFRLDQRTFDHWILTITCIEKGSSLYSVSNVLVIDGIYKF